MGYTSEEAWEEAWKEQPTVKLLKGHGGTLKRVGKEWVAVSSGVNIVRYEVCGRGRTVEAAITDWWENRLMFLIPEPLGAQRAALMLRAAGDARFKNYFLPGYDDEEA